MSPSLTPVRRLLWPMVAAAAAVGLISWALADHTPARARSVPPGGEAPNASGEGLVCFGTVDLQNGVAALAPLQPGRVSEVLIHEGQAVPRGAEILRLEEGPGRSRLSEADAALKLSRLRLEQARTLPARSRERVDQQEAIVKAARSRVAAARQVLSQRQRTSQPAVAAALDLATSELQVSEAEALERAEVVRLAEMEAQDADAEIRRAEYEVAAAEARRDQARLALDECRLKAPAPGTLLRVNVGPGDILGAERGLPAVLFAPDGPQVIRATVEQEFAPRIKEGMAALVQDEADDALTWRGKVERVAGWFSQRRSVLHDPSQMTDVRTLECLIVLDPGQPRLRLGQSVRVVVGRVEP